MRSVAVVGASLGGLSAARSLRRLGFDGRVIMVGAERHRPYDRPPLSKDFLLDRCTRDDLALGTPEDEALDLDWRLGVSAVRLEPWSRTVSLSSGEDVRVDGVVLATGAHARTVPGANDLTGVHTLRTVDDGMALRGSLRRGGPLVVIGAGFIGAEVAASARSMGLDVTVVEARATPMSAILGPEMGRLCAGLHADHGVRLLPRTAVAGFAGPGRVTGVVLEDGSVIPADTVVIGVGAVPNVAWLLGSGVDVRRGVLTDEHGATSIPGVVAVGDCAQSYDPALGEAVCNEHWTNALEQPARAVRALLSVAPAAGSRGWLPYFWSQQYGALIQFAGHRRDGDRVRIIEGDTAQRSFVAAYERDGVPTAVLAMNQPGPFTRLRRSLVQRLPLLVDNARHIELADHKLS